MPLLKMKGAVNPMMSVISFKHVKVDISVCKASITLSGKYVTEPVDIDYVC